jgi:iron(III) transport system ATP-binding protein
VLRAGVIRQVGAPHDLYLRPVDRDIAGFVGDLAVLPATFDGSAAETALGVVPLRETRAGAGEVLVRPEQIELASDGPDAVVTAAEFHGSTGIAQVTCAGLTLTVRCAAHLLPAPGTTVRLRVRGPALLVAADGPPAEVGAPVCDGPGRRVPRRRG